MRTPLGTALGSTCMAIIKLFSVVPDPLAAEPTQAPSQGAVSYPDPSTYGFFPKPFSFQALIRSGFIFSGPRAASVHGWWDQVSSPARTATSRVELWAKGPIERFFRGTEITLACGL